MTQRKRIRPRIYATRPRPAKPTTNLRLQGIAAALGELARAHMEPDLAAMVLASLGLTFADLKAAGADAYDLQPLKPEASTTPAEPKKNPNRVVVEERHTPTATLRLELVACGKGACKSCGGGRRPSHGPYWYAYWKQDGRTRSRYIGKALPAA
jgi:hypothetical protein